MSFNKVTPDLEDPRQNEFVQDYLQAFNEKYNIKSEWRGITNPRRAKDCEAVEYVSELIQEIYSPSQVPYEVQVKQHRIEQLEASLKFSNDRIRRLEAKLDRSLDVLQEHE